MSYNKTLKVKFTSMFYVFRYFIYWLLRWRLSIKWKFETITNLRRSFSSFRCVISFSSLDTEFSFSLIERFTTASSSLWLILNSSSYKMPGVTLTQTINSLQWYIDTLLLKVLFLKAHIWKIFFAWFIICNSLNVLRLQETNFLVKIFYFF